MTIIDLDVFKTWLLDKVAKYPEIITDCKIRDEWRHLDKPGVDVLLVTSDDWSGNILFWNSGESDVFVLDNAGDVAYPVHYVTVASSTDFNFAFQEFFDRLTKRN